VSITASGILEYYDETAGVANCAVLWTVHHQQYRSHSGADLEQNLITLCSECHSTAHVSASKNMDPRSRSKEEPPQ